MNGTYGTVADLGVVSSRTVILASTDAALRGRLRASLTSLRWQVREASGGAEAIALLEEKRAEALMLDSWLPDLDVAEVVGQVRLMDPAIDLLRMDGGGGTGRWKKSAAERAASCVARGAGFPAAERYGDLGRGRGRDPSGSGAAADGASKQF